ncbi:uncharacterized protein LOC111617940 isoform X2 [Centruroides sculpturatus]|uniref:uncharacterized protein LOC111617940 isoform X2 n=1 Tax=Centruroides sculpturatus TaxID=218467 RepID=UPI000C6ED0E3|nr:uncharacterized protein LOC111617940 isoform X2 [Centruroides sculpturatus]XP_023215102.1 uncharacterized protein LOC111617940 isoform X2 [Centruroides sculpturatus]
MREEVNNSDTESQKLKQDICKKQKYEFATEADLITFKENRMTTKKSDILKHGKSETFGGIFKKDIKKVSLTAKDIQDSKTPLSYPEAKEKCLNQSKYNSKSDKCYKNLLHKNPALNSNKTSTATRRNFPLPSKKIKPRNVIASFISKNQNQNSTNESIFEIHSINLKNKNLKFIDYNFNKQFNALNPDEFNDNIDSNNKLGSFLTSEFKKANSEFFIQIKNFLNEFNGDSYDLHESLTKFYQKLQRAKIKFRTSIVIKNITIQYKNFSKVFNSISEEDVIDMTSNYFSKYFKEDQGHTMTIEMNKEFELFLKFNIKFKEKDEFSAILDENKTKYLSSKWFTLFNLIYQLNKQTKVCHFYKEILKLNNYYINHNFQLYKLDSMNCFIVDVKVIEFFERCDYLRLKIQGIVDSKCGKHKPIVIIKETRLYYREYNKRKRIKNDEKAKIKIFEIKEYSHKN